MNNVEIPVQSLESYSHRSEKELEQLLRPETLTDTVLERIEGKIDTSFSTEDIESEFPYHMMLGDIAVPGELDQTLYYLGMVNHDGSPDSMTHQTTETLDFNSVIDDLGQIIEQKISEEDVLGIDARRINNSDEIWESGFGRIEKPSKVYTIVSYGQARVPEEDLRVEVEGDVEAASAVGNEYSGNVFGLTTVFMEKNNGIAEIDYVPPIYDKEKGIEQLL